MNVSLSNNTLTVVLPIAAAVAQNKGTTLKAVDEKNNELYRITFNEEGKGSIANFGITCNAIVDNKLAFIEVLPVGMTEDAVKEKYGDALLAANKYVSGIATAAAEKTAAINALFDAE